MKKIIVFASAAAMLLTLAACGATSPSSPSSSAPGSVSQPAPESPPATESSVPDSAEETMIEGTITDATMNTIAIKTADGISLSFATADADTTAADGLLVDSKVTIYYTGVITGEDTTKAVVTRLEQEKTSSASEASETSSAAK